MVYCGKPSKGCGACRARKVKCDQAKPACNRCIKANRKCPGYRDQLSLLFRDESSSVAQKATSVTNANNKDDNNPWSFDSSSASDSSESSPSPPSGFEFTIINEKPPFNDRYNFGGDEDAEDGTLCLVPLSIDRRQQAICYCVSNFIWLNGSITQGFNIDADISPTASIADKAMMKGIVSVGMANLSRLGAHSESMKLVAQQEYYNALKCTNAAISHPTHATDDATLTAILCMSLFEILTSKNPETVDAFIEHTKGAIALLELRGESQLGRSQALQMFQFLRNEILIGCIIRMFPFPPALLTLSEKATTLPGVPYMFTVSHQTCLLMARLNELRIEDSQSVHTDVDPTFISRAFALDSDFEALTNGLPADYAPQIYTAAPGQYFEHPAFPSRIAPFQGVYHTYETFTGCTALNHLRYGRLFVIEIILDRLRRLTTQPNFVITQDFKDLCYRLRDLGRQLAFDICATVPYLCGFLDGKGNKGHLASAPAGGLALLFPLFVAASVDGAGSPSSNWIKNCFHTIAKEMGIDQALALMQLLQLEKGMVRFIDLL